MKKITTFLLLMAGLTANAQLPTYNLEEVPEKQIIAYEKSQKTVGGFTTVQLGFSPNYPRGFVGLSIGGNYKLLEASIHALPSVFIKQQSTVLSGTLGTRFTINKLFTVTPRAGYWTVWDGESPIEWTRGNRFIYGVEITRKIANNLDLSVTWYDCKSRTSPRHLLISQYGDMKIGLLGFKYIF